jgi:hypothetical protein
MARRLVLHPRRRCCKRDPHAIEDGPAGIYNIVDDDPAEVSIWLPELARSLGAKQPAGTVDSGRSRYILDDQSARFVERKGKTRTELEAPVFELEGGFPSSRTPCRRIEASKQSRNREGVMTANSVSRAAKTLQLPI